MTSLRKFDTTFDTYRFERDLVIVATVCLFAPILFVKGLAMLYGVPTDAVQVGVVARVVLIVNGATLWISYVMLGFLPILRGHTELM